MKKKVNKFRSLDFKNNKFTTILYFLLRLLVLIILIYSNVICLKFILYSKINYFKKIILIYAKQ